MRTAVCLIFCLTAISASRGAEIQGEAFQTLQELRFGGQLEEALAFGVKTLSEHPSDWRIAEQTAWTFIDLGRRDEGIRYFESLLKEKTSYGAGDYALGCIYWSIGYYNKAIAHFERALQEGGPKTDPVAVASVYQRIGECAVSLGEPSRAFENLKTAGSIYERAGHRRGIARVMMEISRVNRDMGIYADAKAQIEEALNIAEEIGDERLRANILFEKGILYGFYLYDFANALQSLNEAADGYKRTGGTARYEATVNTALATLYANMGDIEKALDMHLKSYEPFLKEKALHHATLVSVYIGRHYIALGQEENAFEYFEKAVQLAKEIGAEQMLAGIYHQIADFYLASQKFSSAEQFAEEAKKTFDKAQKKLHSAGISLVLAKIKSQQGKHEEALDICEKARKELAEIGKTESLVLATQAVGDETIALGDIERGVAHYENAVAMAEEFDIPEMKMKSYAKLADGLRQINKREDASLYYEKAIALIEKMRANIRAEEHRAGYLGKRLGVYEGYIEFLLEEIDEEQNRTAVRTAFETAERIKARCLLELLGEARFVREGAQPDIYRRLLFVEARLKWLREQAEKHD